MTLRSAAATTLLVLLAAACTPGKDRMGTMQVTTQSAVIASMAGHKTYAFESIAPAPPGDAQWAGAPLAVAQVKERIDAEMQAKGYVLDPNPELVIRISIGVRKVIDEPKGSAALNGAPVTTNTVTDLEIDVFDREDNGHLFHGTARDELHHREVDGDKLAKAVRIILEPVPPAAR